MTVTIAWLLDLDAELELVGQPIVRSVRHRVRVERLGREFLAIANEASREAAEHVAFDRVTTVPDAVLAWCTTATTRGAQSITTPRPDAVVRANHRAFAAPLDDTLPGARFVSSIDELVAWLDAHAALAPGWLLKRPLGFAGRGRKRVGTTLSPAELRWAAASMTEHGRGLQVEPFVTIESEFGLHAWLDPDGTCVVGEPTTLVSDSFGSWRSSSAGADMTSDERAQLARAASRAADALAGIGYHGPFGIDAFRWIDADGSRRFRPLSDLNARFSMGYFAGMRGRLDQLLRRWTRRDGEWAP